MLTIASDNGSPYGVDSKYNAATLVIADTPLPSVAIAVADSIAGEWDASTGEPNPGSFTVRRSGSSTAESLTVSYMVSGTATNGTDYNVESKLSGQVTIPAGKSDVTVVVHPAADALIEGDESVTLTLTSESSGYALDGKSSAASFTIVDTPLPIVSVWANDSSASEPVDGKSNAGSIAISRTGSPQNSLIVAYELSGTANNELDYGELSGSVTIPAGQTTIVVAIEPFADFITEGTETVIVALVDGADYDLGGAGTGQGSTATGTIADVAPPALQVTVDGTGESDEGSPYSLSMSANQPVDSWLINWGDGAIQTVQRRVPPASRRFTSTPTIRRMNPTPIPCWCPQFGRE